MEYYWDLTLKDGSRLEIPPQAVPQIQKRMADKLVINLRSRSIPYSEIKDFRQTDKHYTSTPLLEEAAQAFKEPVYTETKVVRGDEIYTYIGVKARWVKRPVTQDRWQNYYSKSMYRRIGAEDGMVVVAYRLPVHNIDLSEVSYCTDEEVANLAKEW